MNNKTSDNKFNNNVDSNKIEHIEHIVNNKKNRTYKKYNDDGLTFRYLEAYNNATSDCYVFLKSLEKLFNVEAEIKMSKKIHDEIKSGNLTYSDFLNHKLDVIDKTIKALDINFVNKDADEDNNDDNNNDDGNGNSEENSEEKREKKLQRFRELVNEISGAYDKNDKKDENEEDDSNNSNDSSMSNSDNKRNEDNDKESDIKKDVKNDIKEEDKKEDIKEFLEKKNAEKLERDLKRLKIDSLLDIRNYRGESDKILEFIKTFYDSLRRSLSTLRKYFE